MNITRNSYLCFVRLPIITLILLLSIMGVFAKRGLIDLKRVTQQNALLHQQIEESLSQKQKLERRLEAFRRDPKEQERVIRQTLGYIRKNETIIQFN